MLISVLINLPHISSLVVPLKHLLAVAQATWAFYVSEIGCSQEAQTSREKLWTSSEWEQHGARILQGKRLSSKGLF